MGHVRDLARQKSDRVLGKEAEPRAAHAGRDLSFSPSSFRLAAMTDVAVPPEVTAEITQILSNLVLGDNHLRTTSVPLFRIDRALANPPDMQRRAGRR